MLIGLAAFAVMRFDSVSRLPEWVSLEPVADLPRQGLGILKEKPLPRLARSFHDDLAVAR